MSPQDIGAIARELNLSASAFRTMAQRPSSPELLSKRLALAGFSENALAAAIETYCAMCNACAALCQTKVRCAADLKRQNHASPRKDCSNETDPSRSLVRYPPAALSRLIALNQFLTEDVDS
ncbi:hypothetical protein [Bradyrhizobium sp. WSM1743]|uniref:hypothetical protein n=1 Tax=Bradyrhizobium sp. WSM1743 TaxID=318996 RepID=UPI0012EC7E08|nr:hypothetical protein [Bradyrhizobium sp. WSM1743]